MGSFGGGFDEILGGGAGDGGSPFGLPPGR